ncbi:MAG TPA: phosphotransferase [Acidimicrobiales bacterium]|nr:phosphotransferase [Acidimicrobiales bacterium]
MSRSDHQKGVGGGLSALTEIECPTSGRILRLRRAWPRRPGHLLLEYRDGDSSVAGQWFADSGRLRAVAEQTASVSPDGVSRHAEAGVLLQRRGADRRLPALAGVVADGAATLVVHRPERRAVVRRTRSGVITYVKMIRPGRALPGSVELTGVRVPVVLAAGPHRGMVEHAELAGRALHDLLRDAGVERGRTDIVSRAFGAAGRTVRALHTSTPPAGIPMHHADGEVAVTARWVDQALAHGVFDTMDRVRAAGALEALGTDLAGRASPPSLTLVHRDLHDKQILVVDGDDAGLLDLDTLAVGDPALDVANLLVHLELRMLQGQCRSDVAGVAGDAFLDGYRPDRDLRGRIEAYAAATRLRLACVYAFRPCWQDVAARLLAHRSWPGTSDTGTRGTSPDPSSATTTSPRWPGAGPAVRDGGTLLGA